MKAYQDFEVYLIFKNCKTASELLEAKNRLTEIQLIDELEYWFFEIKMQEFLNTNKI